MAGLARGGGEGSPAEGKGGCREGETGRCGRLQLAGPAAEQVRPPEAGARPGGPGASGRFGVQPDQGGSGP